MPLRPSTAFASTFLELSASPFDVAIAFSNYCRTLPQVILQQTCTLTGRKSPYEGYRSVSVSSVWELNQAFSRSPELREVLWKSSVASSIRLSAGARTSSATSKGSQVCIFFVCLPFADDKACVLVVVSPALRSLRRCQAIARRRDLSDQHQPIASLEATNRECGRNPRCQLLLEASSQLFSSGRHPGSHQL